MKKIIYTLFALVAILIFISATTKIASPCDSPTVGDHSGAPGETDCSGCHSSPVNPDIPNLKFEVGNNETSYIPGKTYLVNLFIKRNGHTKFGFVCSTLDTLNKTNGTFSVINAATTRKYTLGGRNYFSHTPCGADAKDSMQWTFNWTAPSTNKGKIKLYMSMLVANHNHALSGDTTYTRVLTLNPAAASNVNNINSSKAKVYPTYFNSDITIDFDPKYENINKQIELINQKGQIIENIKTNNTKYKINNLNTMANGIYFLKIIYPNSFEMLKVIKQ